MFIYKEVFQISDYKKIISTSQDRLSEIKICQWPLCGIVQVHVTLLLRFHLAAALTERENFYFVL